MSIVARGLALGAQPGAIVAAGLGLAQAIDQSEAETGAGGIGTSIRRPRRFKANEPEAIERAVEQAREALKAEAAEFAQAEFFPPLIDRIGRLDPRDTPDEPAPIPQVGRDDVLAELMADASARQAAIEQAARDVQTDAEALDKAKKAKKQRAALLLALLLAND